MITDSDEDRLKYSKRLCDYVRWAIIQAFRDDCPSVLPSLRERMYGAVRVIFIGYMTWEASREPLTEGDVQGWCADIDEALSVYVENYDRLTWLLGNVAENSLTGEPDADA